jgi:ABC-type sugar transport system permease subunit
MNLAAVMAIVLVILIAGAVVVYVKKVKRDVSVR